MTTCCQTSEPTWPTYQMGQVHLGDTNHCIINNYLKIRIWGVTVFNPEKALGLGTMTKITQIQNLVLANPMD